MCKSHTLQKSLISMFFGIFTLNNWYSYCYKPNLVIHLIGGEKTAFFDLLTKTYLFDFQSYRIHKIFAINISLNDCPVLRISITLCYPLKNKNHHFDFVTVSKMSLIGECQSRIGNFWKYCLSTGHRQPTVKYQVW